MKRAERLEPLIREAVSEILREEVSDPRVGFVSLTAVKLSDDLQNANIHVSVLGNDQARAAAMSGLKSATSFIRGELSQRLELRVTPQLRFFYDDSLARGSRVLGIMKKLENEEHPKSD